MSTVIKFTDGTTLAVTEHVAHVRQLMEHSKMVTLTHPNGQPVDINTNNVRFIEGSVY